MKAFSALTFFNESLEEAQTLNSPLGTACLYTAKRPGREGPNEDSMAVAVVNEDCAILMISDGMGGHRGGDQASRMTIETILKSLKKAGESPSIRERILSGIEESHRKIKRLKVGAGATVVVAEVWPRRVRYYSVGDSIGLLLGGQGALKYKTLEHSAVGFGVEAGLIPQDDAVGHSDSYLLLNALGHDGLRIEMSGFLSRSQRDLVMLASDGLTDNLSHTEISDLVKRGDLLQRQEHLVSKARTAMDSESGSPDDLSFILFKTG